jgi:(R,R)-butanediol dehydrogenase / meso-butanediol dehydrogenase / diacetyl reductase
VLRSGPVPTMRAAVYKGNRTVVVEDIPVPDVGPGQVLLEVSHCGICGSDLHMMMEDMARPGLTGGHEYSGVVAEVGGDVIGWTRGDRAVGGPGSGCGVCGACKSGDTNLCTNRPLVGIDPFIGAFARYKTVDAGSLFRVPDAVDLRSAALTEPLAVALRGVRRAGAKVGDRVLITGAGPIGLLTLAVLRAHGVADITVSEPASKRRALATELGAAQVVTPDLLDRPGLPMQVATAPFQIAFDCSGRADAMELALDNLDRAGTLVLSGTGMKRPRFDANRIILNELVVTGTVEYTQADYHAAIDLLSEQRIPVDRIIEPEDQPLSRLQWAMEQLVAGEIAGKVMVVPDA